MSHLNRMIFVTGFARGGTSWLRTCISSHPEIQMIPREMPLFREHHSNRRAVEQAIEKAIRDNDLTGPCFVNKAPANAPFVGKAARTLPESKFVFIIRDPRDVFISHKRGNQKWMGGRNSTVSGCMGKIQRYYEGYLDAADLPNVLMVAYEQLHQDFHATMARVFRFIGVDTDKAMLDQVFEKNRFWTVASRHREDRASSRRKGVVGDWVEFLSADEQQWFKENAYWIEFMADHGYSWQYPSYEKIFQAMLEANVHFLDEGDLIDQRFDSSGLNVFVANDIDLLNKRTLRSVLDAAALESRLGIPAVFYFLPLDDPRYSALRSRQIVELIKQIRQMGPHLSVGLHLNAAERFFPADAPDLGNDHPDIAKVIAYLHEQIDAYAKHGIKFRTATAHGYGRRKKRPNNRDTPVLAEELAKRGILMWDTRLRQDLVRRIEHFAFCTDVGGAVSFLRMPNNGSPLDSETYRCFPPGSAMHVLIHPGNYDVNRALTLGIRTNTPSRMDIQPGRTVHTE